MANPVLYIPTTLSTFSWIILKQIPDNTLFYP